MQELIIRTPRVEQTSGGSIVRVRLESPSGPFDACIEVTGATVQAGASPFAIYCLPICMAKGWNLRSELPVSSKLLATMPQIQDIFLQFLPGMQRVKVDAPSAVEQQLIARETASFFSGGVDGFYTFLKHRQRISRLIFAAGFDITLSQTKVVDIVQQQIRLMARELEVGLIEVKSNMRQFSDTLLHWRFFIGASMAGTASLLSHLVETVYIGSSHHYGDIYPWGTHPLLDPLWSTEAVNVIYDGCEATRLMKLCLVAKDPVALCRLRVCFNNRDDRYNCSRCEKCIRTMVGLRLLGVLEQSGTFVRQLDLKRISKLGIGDNAHVMRINLENYQYAKKHRIDPALERALQLSLRKTSWIRRARHRIKGILQKPVASTVLGAKIKHD